MVCTYIQAFHGYLFILYKMYSVEPLGKFMEDISRNRTFANEKSLHGCQGTFSVQNCIKTLALQALQFRKTLWAHLFQTNRKICIERTWLTGVISKQTGGVLQNNLVLT